MRAACANACDACAPRGRAACSTSCCSTSPCRRWVGWGRGVRAASVFAGCAYAAAWRAAFDGWAAGCAAARALRSAAQRTRTPRSPDQRDDLHVGSADSSTAVCGAAGWVRQRPPIGLRCATSRGGGVGPALGAAGCNRGWSAVCCYNDIALDMPMKWRWPDPVSQLVSAAPSAWLQNLRSGAPSPAPNCVSPNRAQPANRISSFYGDRRPGQVGIGQIVCGTGRWPPLAAQCQKRRTGSKMTASRRRTATPGVLVSRGAGIEGCNRPWASPAGRMWLLTTPVNGACRMTSCYRAGGSAARRSGVAAAKRRSGPLAQVCAPHTAGTARRRWHVLWHSRLAPAPLQALRSLRMMRTAAVATTAATATMAAVAAARNARRWPRRSSLQPAAASAPRPAAVAGLKPHRRQSGQPRHR